MADLFTEHLRIYALEQADDIAAMLHQRLLKDGFNQDRDAVPIIAMIGLEITARIISHHPDAATRQALKAASVNLLQVTIR